MLCFWASTIRDGGGSASTAKAVSVCVGYGQNDCGGVRLTPDGDVYPELLHVPPATMLVWLNERDAPIGTTMTPAGRHLEKVYGFGALRRILMSPEVTVRAVLGAQETEDTSRKRDTRIT